jgi:ABC-type arginine transport system ATPase subunit
MIVVNKSLTALYGGFRQYDRCCFHRQAIHWVKKDCECCVVKYKSLEPSGGTLSSLIKVLFLLKVIIQNGLIYVERAAFTFKHNVVILNLV